MFLLIASSLYPPSSQAEEQVHWQDVDQLCGQLQLEAAEKRTIVVDGRTETRLYEAYLRGATVTLYPATKADKECCAAGSIATAISRKYGAFEFKGILPGYYWLRVQKNGVTHVIPVHLTTAFNETSCSALSVRCSFVVDASPPKIETRIR